MSRSRDSRDRHRRRECGNWRGDHHRPVLRHWSRCFPWSRLLAATSCHFDRGLRASDQRNKFYAYCSIGQQTQDLKYQGEPTYLEIGEDNTFREFVTVNRSTASTGKTRIGNGGNFLAYSHIGHDCTVGDEVVFSNNGTLAGHVQVGDHAIMGGLTAVHQFCRIGRFAITGGCSKIVQDVPPFMIADGNPAKVRGINLVGLERNNFSAESVKLIKEAFRLIYRSKFNTRQALEAITKELPATEEIGQITEFIRTSERGIIR